MVSFICVYERLGLATQGCGTHLEYMTKASPISFRGCLLFKFSSMFAYELIGLEVIPSGTKA